MDTNIGNHVDEVSKDSASIKSEHINQECQANFPYSGAKQIGNFTCNRYIYMHDFCDAEVQTEIPNIDTLQTLMKVKNSNALGLKKNKKQQSSYGFPSIKYDERIEEIAGVNLETFNFLLKRTENQEEGSTITKEQKLLIFLVKMKTGLSFSAIGVFFSLDDATVSEIFFSTLKHLSSSTANLVFWPQRDIVQETIPEHLKAQYSKIRVILDCIEFKIDAPSSLDDRISLYSCDKKCFGIKVLIGITPSGFICFKSKAVSSSASESQIIIKSNLIDLLKDKDQVLADKRFAAIQSTIDASNKRVSFIMPPFFQTNFEFAKITDMNYSIAVVIKRLRNYQIFDLISNDLLPCIDNIIHVACGLVNLQPQIFSN